MWDYCGTKKLYKNRKPIKIKGFERFFVPLEKLITNKVYLGFKKLYDLKPVLEEAGLYPLDRISPSLSPRI